ncbi:ead/Ea22-like family protein [Citrobacter farmeri]
MSNIDKQALREAANAANSASWGNWESYKPHKGARGYEVKVGPKAVAQHCLKVDSAFIAAANPATMLALLDELEADKKRIAELREWNAGLAQESFTYQQRVAELQSVNDELTKFPDQIVSYVARMGTSEIGSHAKDVIYRAAQKVKDRAAGISKGE